VQAILRCLQVRDRHEKEYRKPIRSGSDLELVGVVVHDNPGVRRRRVTQPRRTMVGVSDAADRQQESAHGSPLLPSDLTDEQLAAAPVLASIDTLLIEDLSEDEDEAFAAALDS
jgi:hypothetical protein